MLTHGCGRGPVGLRGLGRGPLGTEQLFGAAAQGQEPRSRRVATVPSLLSLRTPSALLCPHTMR